MENFYGKLPFVQTAEFLLFWHIFSSLFIGGGGFFHSLSDLFPSFFHHFFSFFSLVVNALFFRFFS